MYHEAILFGKEAIFLDAFKSNMSIRTPAITVIFFCGNLRYLEKYYLLQNNITVINQKRLR
jgi:hypothetical protein